MKTFSPPQTIPVAWLACLLITLSTTDMGAQGQTPPNSVRPGMPSSYFNNPYATPNHFVPPTPPQTRQIDPQLAHKALRKHIADIRKRARKGDYKATYNLGVFYIRGAGVPLDFESAFRHFKKSAEDAVYAPAMFNLAICYATGTGTTIDRVQAYKWWNLAAAQGHPQAAQARDNIGKIIRKSGIAAARRMSGGYEQKLETRIRLEELRAQKQKINQPGTTTSATP